ncbi:MAG TPA: DNA starvation/stationary phase protection protein [Bacteroidetes bacterium]|nr:DNA starvation/stationary phase protection protein [Bacteroidota bacterium]
MTKQLNAIALDIDNSKLLAEKLNLLLADYHVFYMNTRGYHWNIKGHKFFELHIKFEELYTDLAVKIDEIAERILTLGHIPLHTFTDLLKNSDIKEKRNVSDGFEAMKEILHSFQIILKSQRELLTLSAEADDEGTNSLMSDYITQQEKLVWMYNSYMS